MTFVAAFSQLKYFSKGQRAWIEALFGRIRLHYGDNLCSLAIYGSYARRENKMDSDLDLFIVLNNCQLGRLARQEDFVVHIENTLELQKNSCDISSIILDKDEANHFLPIYLDMTQAHVLLVDQDDFLKRQLEKTKRKMEKWGSIRRQLGGHWHWVLCPSLRWGECIDYDK